ncbi:SRPBCC family protein [Arenimonas sp.]|uniref:SRPBCC family protein n=1 Tax=Arenimonas sp. TaxID=1872635 RepID=UPI0039E36A57
MKIELRADHAVDDASAMAGTGRTLKQWFAELDAFGGPGKGRREIGNRLYDTHKLDPWWIATLNIEYEAAHGLKEKDGRAKGYTICATKSVKAAPDACHAAFASAGALDAWLGSKHALDFRDGGALTNADGNRATIRKINPGKTIKLVWEQSGAGEGTPVEVKFQPAGAKTTVMITHDRLQTRAEADGFRRAWGEALERLKAKLEG